MTSKGPGLFIDIGKKARDLLTKDYSYDQRFTIYSSSNLGVDLASTTVKKGGLSSGDISAVYKYNNSTFDFKIDTDSKTSSTFTFSELLPSTKCVVLLKLPEYTSGKVEVQYFHDHATFTASSSLRQTPLVDLSATFGTSNFAVGSEAAFDASSGTFIKCNAGLSVTKPDSVSTVIIGEKGDMLRVSHLHHMDEARRSSAVAEFTRRFSSNENTFTVGGSCNVDYHTAVKARLNNHGKLGALVQHEVKTKSFLTISSELDTRALSRIPQFGLALSLKP